MKVLLGRRSENGIDVRKDFELESKVLGFAGFAMLGTARRAIVGRREMDVARPPPAPLATTTGSFRRGDVEEKRAGLRFGNPACDRNEDLEVLPARP